MDLKTAQVDSSGTQLSYYDSGPLETPYTTLVCIHGLSYHAKTFSKLISLGQKRHYRIIALNRRGYPGSTPFSAEELSLLLGKDEASHKKYLYQRGLELASFLCHIIKDGNLYPASPGQGTGGIIMTGWSLGNAAGFAFLGHLDSYPTEIVQAIRPYLKAYFVYGAPAAALGFHQPEEVYNPFREQDIPDSERPALIQRYIASYYSHPIYNENNEKKLERTLSSLQDRPSDTAKTSTILDLPEKELSTFVDENAMYGFEFLTLGISHEIIQNLIRKAVTADPQVHLKIYLIYGLEDMWDIQWSTWEFQKLVEHWRQEGAVLRPIGYLRIPEAAHFVHWDDPELFFGLYN